MTDQARLVSKHFSYMYQTLVRCRQLPQQLPALLGVSAVRVTLGSVHTGQNDLRLRTSRKDSDMRQRGSIMPSGAW